MGNFSAKERSRARARPRPIPEWKLARRHRSIPLGVQCAGADSGKFTPSGPTLTLSFREYIPDMEQCQPGSADLRLAERLRALRRARSWSLDELSAHERSEPRFPVADRERRSEPDSLRARAARRSASHNRLRACLPISRATRPRLSGGASSRNGSIRPPASAAGRSRRRRSASTASFCPANCRPARASTIRFRHVLVSNIIFISRTALWS